MVEPAALISELLHFMYCRAEEFSRHSLSSDEESDESEDFNPQTANHQPKSVNKAKWIKEEVSTILQQNQKINICLFPQTRPYEVRCG